MTDYTKAPWQARRNTFGSKFFIDTDSDEKRETEIGVVWKEADAHLMAAAPELLEELAACRSHLASLTGLERPLNEVDWKSIEYRVERVNKLIAKARNYV